MIVACEHCGARYKLDESRIAGRGAKVTCPKCRHVFVVFKDAPAVDAAVDPEPPTAVAGAPGPLGAPLPASPTPAPAPTEVVVDAPPPPGPDVHSLEFRKVGIASWKVKVKIGLVYDFSDFKTLKKYIAEGRVTPADLLSHDGKAWTPIGEIPDLERHFVDVYLRAEAALAPPPAAAGASAAPVLDDYVEDDPTNIMGMAGLSAASKTNLAALPAATPATAKPAKPAAAPPRAGNVGPSADLNALLAAASAEVDGPAPAAASPAAPARPAEPTGPRFVDPFEQRRKEKAAARAQSPAPAAPRPSSGPRTTPPPPAAAPAPAAGGGGRVVLLAGLLVLVAAGGAAWWFLRDAAPPPPPKVAAPAPGPAKAPPPAAPPAAPDRAVVQQDLLSGSTPATPEETEEAFKVDGEKELIPVGPRDNPRAGRPASGGGAAAPPASGGGGAPAGGDQAMSARDHAAEGDAAYRRGDYATAVAAYRQATGLEPRNAAYQGKLGAALYRSGDTGGAMEPLSAGARGGHAASYDLLGDIAAAQGDVSGAIGYYQSYLQARPSDAARVQAKIDRLSGGG